MPRRILVFSLNYYPRFIGGAEIAIKEITDRIDPRVIEFHMITLRFDSTLPRIERIGNILVHRIGFSSVRPSIVQLKQFPLHFNKYLFQVLAPLMAIRLHWRYRYSAVWAMMVHSCGIPAVLFNFFYPRVPYLLSLQEGDPLDYIQRLMRPVRFLFRRAFTHANSVQAISTFLAQFASTMGYRGVPIVIPNGVDIALFSTPVPKEIFVALRPLFQQSAGKTFLITVSRLVAKNAVDDIIRALALLPLRYHLLIIGIGPEEGRLRALTVSLGVSNRTSFLGAIANNELSQYLQHSQIFIRPSLSEGMGNVFIEAFAAGTPVIATQVGGIADFLFDVERNPGTPPTGYAVDAHDPRAIAQKVEYIMHNSDEVRYTTDNARKFIRTMYDWDDIARRMHSCFDQLVALPHMKILIATGIYPPDIGGPATYSKLLYDELPKRGMATMVLTFGTVRHLPPVIRHAVYFFNVLWFGWGVDIIFALDAVSVGLPAMVCAKILRKKFVIKIVGDYAWEQGTQRFGVIDDIDTFQERHHYHVVVRLLNIIQKFVARQAAMVIVPSEYLKRIIRGWGVQDLRIHVIYNAVESMESVLPQQKLAAERWVVSVGRLVPWKGFRALINVCNALRNDYPDLRLKVVGDGPEHAELSSQIDHLHLQDVVQLVGRKSHDETLRYIAAADVFVLNSGYEGLSHVLIEALQLGVPVMASRKGGNPELVVPGKTGVVFEYNNFEEIMQQLRAMLGGTVRVDRGSSAHTAFLRRFDFKHMIDETQRVLRL